MPVDEIIYGSDTETGRLRRRIIPDAVCKICGSELFLKEGLKKDLREDCLRKFKDNHRHKRGSG
jgi:hypothetical protein